MPAGVDGCGTWRSRLSGEEGAAPRSENSLLASLSIDDFNLL